jgi:hypothetical protein
LRNFLFNFYFLIKKNKKASGHLHLPASLLAFPLLSTSFH